MSSLKPFFRITILSTILACLLIYLGIKYHWGDHLKPSKPDVLELSIPENNKKPEKDLTTDPKAINKSDFNIIENGESPTLLSSMNKEQLEEQCINLLSTTITDTGALEIATANCVVSNYQETFQDNALTAEQTELLQRKKTLLRKQCQQQYLPQGKYSNIETQLLIGICVSDRI